MKPILLLICLVAFNGLTQNYWQQKVDYKIDVELNDRTHTLKGNLSLIYTNNSPNQLTELFIHLWPNAYSSDQTALAKQIYQDGNQHLRFGADSLKGSIDSLAFSINKQAVDYTFHNGHKDIAKINLVTPLNPGESLTLQTPFKVNIPSGIISRLGHIGQSYQITQWYPKPAVYDKNGWHPYPYLNQGEFYSEYGTFDVRITLPENYTVGATGDLQDESEIRRLNDLAETTADKFETGEYKGLTNETPASAKKTKTLRYKQKDVHDFAWFADKRYWVLKDEVELPHSKRKVTTYAMFTPKNAEKWEQSSEYLKDGTYYYSLWNGDYPYNQVTAVDGTISAGGGMEYPNVTVIGNASSKEELEIVIVHEVGHNWFYGILGTDERMHGWMDEGLNTLNEIRYIQTKYPGNTRLSDMVLNGRFHMDHLDYHDQADYQYQLLARIGEDQPIETPSADFTSINYGIVMYQKTGLVFHYMKAFLGDEKFDACMHAYFDQWKFKHPQPEDLQAIFEKQTKQKLDWFFKDLIETTAHLDFKLKKVELSDGKTAVVVKNVGQVKAPAIVGIELDSGEYEIMRSKQAIEIGEKDTLWFSSNAENIAIDPTNHIPEINRANNYWHKKGIFGKLERPKLEILTGNDDPATHNIYWLPTFGYNVSDKAMLGLTVHNYSVNAPQFLYRVTPLYSFGGQTVSGLADFNYSFLPKRNPTQIKMGTHLRKFTLRPPGSGIGEQFYWAALPYIQMKFRNRQAQGPWQGDLQLKGLYRSDVTRPGTKFILLVPENSMGGQISLNADYITQDVKWNNQLINEYIMNSSRGDEMARTRLSSTFAYRYIKKDKEKWIELRAFAGNTWRYSVSNIFEDTYRLSLTGANGNQDLFFEDISFNRQNSFGDPRSIRMENMGGFKSVSGYGSTRSWMASANLYAELPYFPIFGVFADAGVFESGQGPVSAFDLGVGLRIRKVFRVYFPIVASSNLENSLTGFSYGQTVRFSLHLNFLERPLEIKSLF